jgi:hypothetical protein
MDKVTVIFCKGDNGIIDTVIDTVEQGEFSHSAIKILGGTFEALGVMDKGDLYPGAWLHPLDKYDNNPNVVQIDVEIPDLTYAELKATELKGTLYGYISCVTGGLHDLLGIHLRGDGEFSNDCSELVTRVLKAGGLDLFPVDYPDNITPQDLYNKLQELKS